MTTFQTTNVPPLILKRSSFLNISEKKIENTKQTGINRRDGGAGESEKEEEEEDPAKQNTNKKERNIHPKSFIMDCLSNPLRSIKYA